MDVDTKGGGGRDTVDTLAACVQCLLQCLNPTSEGTGQGEQSFLHSFNHSFQGKGFRGILEFREL